MMYTARRCGRCGVSIDPINCMWCRLEYNWEWQRWCQARWLGVLCQSVVVTVSSWTCLSHHRSAVLSNASPTHFTSARQSWKNLRWLCLVSTLSAIPGYPRLSNKQKFSARFDHLISLASLPERDCVTSRYFLWEMRLWSVCLSATFVYCTLLRGLKLSAIFIHLCVPEPSFDLRAKFYGDRPRGEYGSILNYKIQNTFRNSIKYKIGLQITCHSGTSGLVGPLECTKFVLHRGFPIPLNLNAFGAALWSGPSEMKSCQCGLVFIAIAISDLYRERLLFFV